MGRSLVAPDSASACHSATLGHPDDMGRTWRHAMAEWHLLCSQSRCICPRGAVASPHAQIVSLAHAAGISGKLPPVLAHSLSELLLGNLVLDGNSRCVHGRCIGLAGKFPSALGSVLRCGIDRCIRDSQFLPRSRFVAGDRCLFIAGYPNRTGQAKIPLLVGLVPDRGMDDHSLLPRLSEPILPC